MISLCKDSDAVVKALNSRFDSDYLRSMILLYFHSYGTAYDFVQFYLQYGDDKSCTSVILRYNNTVYVYCLDECDAEELGAFLSGFSGCEVFISRDIIEGRVPFVRCYIMGKKGADATSYSDVSETVNARAIADLVGYDMDTDSKTDFFLNVSHMLRHNTLNVLCKYCGSQIVCAVSASCFDDKCSVINFAFTDSYFRGKGYCSDVLNALCTNSITTYLLACEEHNVPFYKKCNFTHIADCVKYNF